MRTLVVTRGIPGSGKSTYLENMGFSEYVVSPDSLRLMFASPICNTDGELSISQADNKKVWGMVKEVLAQRMAHGHFTIVDATHVSTQSLRDYKQLADQFRYRLVCLDFSDVSLQVALDRNISREEHKRVPESVIRAMHQKLVASEIPGYYEVVRPGHFSPSYPVEDFNHYYQVNFIGDIQGCLTPLNLFLKKDPRHLPDAAFVFVGDYLDRGPQNGEVLRLLMQLHDLPNVYFIEGNHEEHLRRWANGRVSFSREFEARTKPQLEAAELDKSQVRQFCRKFRQALVLDYDGKRVYVTHAGIPTNRHDLLLLPTHQLTHGVGDYGFNIDQAWTENTQGEAYQVHGHRNGSGIPIDEFDRSFNLEGEVEFGGALRVATLTKEGWSFGYFQNTDPCPENPWKKKEVAVPFVERLRADCFISEHPFGEVSSFVHKRPTAFSPKEVWSRYSTQARGLFIDTTSGEIVSRGFDKMFYFEENTGPHLQYPVQVVVKENGFLGLLGTHRGELVFSSKGSISSDHAKWFKELFEAEVEEGEAEGMYQEMMEKNASLAFEVVDVKNDPHIIEYSSSNLTLLAAIGRQEQFKERGFCSWNGNRARLVDTIDNFKELLSYIQYREKRSLDNLRAGEGREIEGYVLKDSLGKMLKVKLPYYNFWKDARAVKEGILKAKERSLPGNRGWEYFKNCRENELSKALVRWMLEQPAEVLRQDITTVRKLYLGKT